MSPNDQQILQTIEHISSLLLKKTKEELNVEEQAALNNWFSQRPEADRQFFDTATDLDEIEKALQFMYGIDEEKALADVLNMIQPAPVQVVPVVPFRKGQFGKKVFFKYAAAAIITGTIVTTAVLVFNGGNRKPNVAALPMAQRYHNDVQPGNDKAILQLADGRSIVLDSMQNGTIANQGNSAVNKQDGVVRYNSNQQNKVAAIAWNTLRTPRGGQYQLQLPDGSKVWLNAQSSLRFPATLTGNERQVELTGEAYFEVTKNPQMPFRVNMMNATGKPSGQVEVLGTHFNINAYDDEEAMRTTLLEGKVKMSALDNGESTLLKPGEQSSLSQSSHVSQPIPVQTEEAIAWKEGLFRFQDASIESIMRQVARWYDVEIVYDGKVDKQFIGTIPRQVPVSTLLKILESTGWVHFVIEGKKITVVP
jgi:transmembrane sensor